MIQATDGDLYGTAYGGGVALGGNCANYLGCGTIFRLSVGLGPFVKPQPAFGAPGAIVQILGADLTGSTSVTFDGTPASFKVASSSLVLATVPADATTGKIEVVTPSGALSSNAPFSVAP